MNQFFKIAFFVIVLLFPSVISGVTLDECISIGISNNKGLHSSMLKYESAKSKVWELRSMLLPSIKTGIVYTRLSELPPAEISFPAPINKIVTIAPSFESNFNSYVSIQQPIFTGFSLLGSIGSAKYTADSMFQDYQKDKNELVYAIKSSYWNLYRSQELSKLVKENITQVETHLNDAQNLFNKGLLMDNDLLKIKLQLSSVKLKQIEFNNSVQLAAINMNNLLSRPIDTAIEPATELKYSNDKIEPLSAYLEKAKAGRPELKSAQARISAAKEGIAVSRSKHFPQMYLTGNYVNAKPNQRIFPAVDEYKDTWDIGVSLTLDIWSWGRINSQVTQSKLQAAQLQDAVRQIEDNVVMEVAQNYFNVISGKEKIAIAEQNISLAEDNFRITKNKFNQGLSLNSELLDAEISLLNAKTDYTQALVDYELAKAKLLKSTGE